MSQRTSASVGVEPVSTGLARQIGRMAEDAVLKYPGGNARAELAKGNPNFPQQFNDLVERLAGQRAETLLLTERPTWKAIQIGIHPSADALRTALLDAGCKISEWGSDILAKVIVTTKPTEVELVRATVTELGFPNGATRAQIYKAGLALGWQLCQAEDGPQLRLQHLDQPAGEWDLIAMEPIAGSDGGLEVFYVVHDEDGLWLRGHYGDPGSFWGGSDRWVFRRK